MCRAAGNRLLRDIYNDGVLRVDLHGSETPKSADEILRELYSLVRDDKPCDDVEQAVRQAFDGKRYMVVLDDAPPTYNDIQGIVDVLAGSLCIVTTRTKMAGWQDDGRAHEAQPIRFEDVPILEPADARQLLVNIMQQGGRVKGYKGQVDEELLISVAADCRGNSFCLTLAGVALRDMRNRSFAEAVSATLAALRDSSGETADKLVLSSSRRLEAGVQTALHRLAMFEGSFTEEEACGVLGDETWIPQLESLLEARLVDEVGDAYELHVFTRTCVRDAAPDEAVKHFARWCESQLQQFDASNVTPESLQAFRVMASNAAGALSCAATRSDDATMCSLSNTLVRSCQCRVSGG